MEFNTDEVRPHPKLIDTLFAFRRRVSSVFDDVLGIFEIRHVAITRISPDLQLSVLSSTPAMEFNLFSGNLWRFDNTFNPVWFKRCIQTNWQTLYQENRYDELYYLRQIKHQLPLGLSLSSILDDTYYIYSLASNLSCKKTQELFVNHHEEFYKIGQYCANMLAPLFPEMDREIV